MGSPSQVGEEMLAPEPTRTHAQPLIAPSAIPSLKVTVPIRASVTEPVADAVCSAVAVLVAPVEDAVAVPVAPVEDAVAVLVAPVEEAVAVLVAPVEDAVAVPVVAVEDAVAVFVAPVADAVAVRVVAVADAVFVVLVAGTVSPDAVVVTVDAAELVPVLLVGAAVAVVLIELVAVPLAGLDALVVLVPVAVRASVAGKPSLLEQAPTISSPVSVRQPKGARAGLIFTFAKSRASGRAVALHRRAKADTSPQLEHGSARPRYRHRSSESPRRVDQRLSMMRVVGTATFRRGRAAIRFWGVPADRANFLGFRCVRGAK